jgi:uncharacterized membrane protein YhaH (DUF805 family)
MNFDDTFVYPNGRTSREHFVPALIVLVAALAFYAFLVTGRTAQWCMLVLVFPAFVLHARRLHDMGRSAWLLAIPTIIAVAAFAIWLQIFSLGAQLDTVVYGAALVLFAAFALWGCVGKQK